MHLIILYLSPIFWWWFNFSWCFFKSSKVLMPLSTNSLAFVGPMPDTRVNKLIATLLSSLLICKITTLRINTKRKTKVYFVIKKWIKINTSSNFCNFPVLRNSSIFLAIFSPIPGNFLASCPLFTLSDNVLKVLAALR